MARVCVAAVVGVSAVLGGGVERAGAQCPDLFNYGIQCNGNQWVTVPNATSLSALNQVTAEAWVKLATTLSLQTGGIIAKWNDVQGSSQRGYLLWVSAGRPYFLVSHSGVDYVAAIGPNLLPMNEWHHLAGVYDGAFVRLYIDGVQVAQTATTGAIHATPTESLYIGLAKAGGGSTAVWFDGQIDEVRVWNVGRTPDQIWKFHNIRVTGGEPGLVGGWNFDDLTHGQFTYDSTAGNNTGTLGQTSATETYDPQRIATGEPVYPVAVNWPTAAEDAAAASGCTPAGTLTLSMSVGFPGATSIQWYKDNVLLANGPTGTGSTIAGATLFDLTVTNTSSADSGQYVCRVGGCGSGPWASNIRQVTICGGPATGACCDGPTCTSTTSATCTGGGKHFAGAGSACNAAGNNTAPCCRADYNGVNGLNAQDIFDFLGDWFAGASRADFNRSGGLSAQDIFDFLGAWFAGC